MYNKSNNIRVYHIMYAQDTFINLAIFFIDAMLVYERSVDICVTGVLS